MEKTNELNKFLSYIHMGMSIYRIYHEQAKKLEDKKLEAKIVKIEEVFKTHEEKVTKMINSFNEEATNSLTAAGIMGVYKEKLKVFDDSFSVCINAIKATNMGMISSIKFLNDNKELHEDVRKVIVEVIKDYENIEKEWIDYILVNICK